MGPTHNDPCCCQATTEIFKELAFFVPGNIRPVIAGFIAKWVIVRREHIVQKGWMMIPVEKKPVLKPRKCHVGGGRSIGGGNSKSVFRDARDDQRNRGRG